VSDTTLYYFGFTYDESKKHKVQPHRKGGYLSLERERERERERESGRESSTGTTERDVVGAKDSHLPTSKNCFSSPLTEHSRTTAFISPDGESLLSNLSRTST